MRISLLFFMLFMVKIIHAQVAWIQPSDANVDSTVTVFFDATQGDQGLMNFTENVYAHTGVITIESVNDTDWKYVVSDWGTDDPNVLMTRINENLYSISFNIRTFYGIPEDETVFKLAFVFRNVDGSVTARNADGSDITIPLQINSDWEYQSYTNSESGLVITTSGGQIIFRDFIDGIETELIPNGNSTEISYAIDATYPGISFSVTEIASNIIATGQIIEISIQKSPLKIYYIQNDTVTVLKSFFTSENGNGGILTLEIDENDKIYGGGSRALPFNLRGYNLELYNQAHYGYNNFQNNLNVSIPVFVSANNIAWIFDNHHPGSVDISSEGLSDLNYQCSGGNLRYYVTAGNDLTDISNKISSLTGKAPLPPIWSLGFIQSRYGYETQTESESIVSQMRDANFPMDALVLDLYWFGGTNRMGDFDWDYVRFPNPDQMIGTFKSQGVETVLITEPYFTLESDHYNTLASLGHFAEHENGDPFVLWGFWAGDASLFDMSSSSARDWLWPKYENLLNQNIGGLWTDLGEPETHPSEMIHEGGSAAEVHNIFNNLWAEMINENFETTFTDRRMFNLTRSGYTGMQRYGTYPWSGDIQRSFEGLQSQIPIMLHMSMSGIGYMHSDLGGFTGGGENSELYTRWLQLGAFSPIMRAHGTGVPTEPIFYDQQTQNYVRDAINLRYDFLPYNYTLAWEYSTTGIPLARPMNYYAESGTVLDDLGDQFLWGKNVLVAPVLSESVTSRLVYLPAGKWVDYNSGEIYNGNTSISVSAPLSKVPVFLREGSFVVQTLENLMSTMQYDSDSIQIKHFLCAEGQSSSQNWYHDDGSTPDNLLSNNYNLMKISGSTVSSVSNITLEVFENNINNSQRLIEFMVYGLNEAPQNITLNGSLLSLTSSQSSYDENMPSAYWDGTFLYIHFNWFDNTINIELNGNPADLNDNIEKESCVVIAPNPVQKQSVVKVWVDQPAEYEFHLVGIDGKVYGKQTLNLTSGKQSIPLVDIVYNFNVMNAGVYFLQVQSGSLSETVRLVKANL
jgi:alpha-glucosidase (family GH31 glycosyl hydrolase)